MAVKEFEYVFDPVKELKGGEQSAKVVWSTKSLDMAVDAIKKGLPLKANPFCGSNTLLLKPDLVYKRTAEEVEDVMRCMKDPIYFATKCSLMTPEGLQPVKMRDYQEEYLGHLRDNRFNIMLACRQAGKSVTTAVFGLWKILFFSDKNGSILSKSGPAGRDLLKKIKDMYLYLPYHLKCGTLKWNQSEIAFDNNSTLSTEAFSPTACLGKTINLLILDEFAWCPPNDVNLFYENVIPTVTTIPDSNVCICSTQNGFNKFYEIWNGAITGKSIYHPYKVDWYQVPNWDPETRKWVKRTKDWKDMMIGVLGSEESFQYQYGTAFLTSNNCLISREVLSFLHSKEILYSNNIINKIDLIPCHIRHYENFYIDPDYNVSNFKHSHYIVIVDLAEGKESDSTIFNILEVIYDKEKDKITFKQVAYWKSNEHDLLESALEFWLLIQTLFKRDQSNVIVSIEWNTYGALFYNYLIQYNEKEYCKDNIWRFNFATEFDHTILCRYKKNSSDEDIISARLPKNNKLIPGVRWNGSNKKSSCALLKPMIESGDIIINDIVTISEIENFEDKNNNGHYKASYGHDDIIMTFVQLPMIIQSAKYKEFVEDIKSNKQEFNNSSWPGYGQNDFMSMNDNFYETNNYLPIPGWN